VISTDIVQSFPRPEAGANDRRCGLRPDPGPCKGLFTRYYFDPEKKECRSFMYGGCQGVVPFETNEECEALCLPRNNP